MPRNCLSCLHEDKSGRTHPCNTCSSLYSNWETKKEAKAETASAPTQPIFPEDDAFRASIPMFDGALAYFPNAIAYVAFVSKNGSDKHNPGQPMHWARSKSTDHKNKIARHLVEAGGIGSDGVRHSGNLAWRALALLQTELEEAGLCPPSPASKFD